MTNKKHKIVAYILNSFIVVTTISIMILYLTGGATESLGKGTHGINALRAFTNLSNIFCAVVALLLIIFPKCPNWLRRLQFMSTTAVFLTFSVVVIFLNPLFMVKTGELFSLFSGSMLFTHLINPLLSILVFIFFTPNKYAFSRRDYLINIIPIFCYGVVYFLNVLAFQTWPDFYNFTFDGQLIFVPIVMATILGLAFELSKVLALLADRLS